MKSPSDCQSLWNKLIVTATFFFFSFFFFSFFFLLLLLLLPPLLEIATVIILIIPPLLCDTWVLPCNQPLCAAFCYRKVDMGCLTCATIFMHTVHVETLRQALVILLKWSKNWNMILLSPYGVAPKWVVNFPWIFFYAIRSLVPVGHFRNISGQLFTWFVCGSFQWRHGLSFPDCIVRDDKDKVIGFKRSHWIHLGWWSAGSAKLQLFQLSQHSHVTNWWLISSSAYFLWNMTLIYKMQLSEGFWDKVLHSKSRTQRFSKKKIFFFFFWRFVSQSDTPKFRK